MNQGRKVKTRLDPVQGRPNSQTMPTSFFHRNHHDQTPSDASSAIRQFKDWLDQIQTNTIYFGVYEEGFT
jgi:hypothetical protein